MRRDVVAELTAQRGRVPTPRLNGYDEPALYDGVPGTPQMSVYVRQAGQITQKLLALTPAVLYVPLSEILENPDLPGRLGVETQLAAVLPRVVWSGENEKLVGQLKTVFSLGVRQLLVGNLGQLRIAKAGGFAARGDFGLNIYNSRAMNALVGKSGVELAFEDYLHGSSGTKYTTVSKTGEVLEEYYKTLPEPGDNVELTIDISLQAVAEDALEKTILSLRENGISNSDDGKDAEGGAVVVEKVKTGEVLAMHKGVVLSECEPVPLRERAGEYLMLRLRTVDGVEEGEYTRSFLLPFKPLEKVFLQLQKGEYAAITNGRWHLTPKGFMGSDAVPHAMKNGDGVYVVELTGENLGILIGRRGETLDAIQHLANYAVNRGEEKRVRINVDAENYRLKREESLQRLAVKIAGKVVKDRRNVTLEPMNAYERHVIHAALQDEPDITTYSTGTEPNRRVIVAYSRFKSTPAAPKDEAQPETEPEAELEAEPENEPETEPEAEPEAQPAAEAEPEAEPEAQPETDDPE